MAAPNIVNVSTILGRTAMVRLTNSTATQVLANAANSNKVLKLAGVLATNTEGVSINVAFNLYITRSATDFYLARNVTIPALASYEAFSKDGTPIYLEEGDTLMAKSENASGNIHVIVAYEDIS
jgi:uncharacterized protein YacL